MNGTAKSVKKERVVAVYQDKQEDQAAARFRDSGRMIRGFFGEPYGFRMTLFGTRSMAAEAVAKQNKRRT
ncbi:MAG: hypothetical protein J0M10_16305 [Chitinophagales bacterium]|nr:hypothetical protein [Chitinophagales bacterium]